MGHSWPKNITYVVLEISPDVNNQNLNDTSKLIVRKIFHSKQKALQYIGYRQNLVLKECYNICYENY